MVTQAGIGDGSDLVLGGSMCHTRRDMTLAPKYPSPRKLLALEAHHLCSTLRKKTLIGVG